jgi:hypothetical protein
MCRVNNYKVNYRHSTVIALRTNNTIKTDKLQASTGEREHNNKKREQTTRKMKRNTERT